MKNWIVLALAGGIAFAGPAWPGEKAMDHREKARSKRSASPAMEERREGANPVQGQVDPKEREQHRDFRQRGDQAGPQSRETAPRR